MTPDLVLAIYLHGFKGDESTFLKFPERLNHIVSETLPDCVVESIVFPSYETKGDLGAAVTRFVDWLAMLTVKKETEHTQTHGGKQPKAKIVLCGHSMGGLLAADALISISTQHSDAETLMWPRVIGLLTFDTPFLGLHPNVFKNTFAEAAGHAQTAKDVLSAVGLVAPAIVSSFTAWTRRKSSASSAAAGAEPGRAPEMPPKEYSDPFGDDNHHSGGDSHFQQRRTSEAPPLPALNQPIPRAAPNSAWGGFTSPVMYGVGAVAVAAGAAGAYVKRNDINGGLNWAQEHMKYVGNLWDGEKMSERLFAIDRLIQSEDIVFRDFYTQLPEKKGILQPRTFCILPQPGSPTRGQWVSVRNNLSKSEIQAHTEMFAPLSNDNYYDLGLRAAECVALSVTLSRRHDAKLRGDAEPDLPSVAARRGSLALSPNLGGSLSVGFSAGGVGGVPQGSSPGGRRKSSSASLAAAAAARRRSSAAAAVPPPLVEGVGSPAQADAEAADDDGAFRSPSLGNPLHIGQFGAAMELEMERRGSELSVAFEEDDDEQSSPSGSDKGKARAAGERRESETSADMMDDDEGLDETTQEALDLAHATSLKHNDGLGIVV